MSRAQLFKPARPVNFIGYIAAAFILSTTAHAESARERLGYEPAQVEISGTVTLEQHYGPPGYGEDPSTDEKVVAIVLKLDTPVDVIATTHSGPDQESFFSVSKMQLDIFNDQQLDDCAGQHVTLRGELFERENGNHYTNVLMQVESRVMPSNTAS